MNSFQKFGESRVPKRVDSNETKHSECAANEFNFISTNTKRQIDCACTIPIIFAHCELQIICYSKKTFCISEE